MPKNTGKEFETLISRTCGQYQVLGLLYAEKVDPPTVMRKIQGKWVPVQCKNPFLDFVGVLMPQDLDGGRMIQFETKDHAGTSLPVGGDSGLTKSQWIAARNWEAAGSVVFVLWRRPGVGLQLWKVGRIRATLAGRKSLPWGGGTDVPDTIYGQYPFPDFLSANSLACREDRGKGVI